MPKKSNKPKKNSKPYIDVERLPDTALVRLNSLLETGQLPFSRATTWRWVKAGKFPPPIKISGHISAWQMGVIRLWRAKLIAENEEA